MGTPRSVLANDPLSFGRRLPAAPARTDESKAASTGENLRLFVMTFTAGFLFMSVFLA
jgi:hypothetical protein